MAAKKPGRPQCTGISSNCVTIEWIKPKDDGKEILHYELRYKEKDTTKWSTVCTENESTLHDVNDLRSSTSYNFKVRAIFNDRENEDQEEGPYSDLSEDIKTKESLFEKIKRNARIIPNDQEDKDGLPIKYKIPLTETYVHKESRTRRCIFKNPHVPLVEGEKSIILLGATGSGKTMLVDGMANFLLGVAWEEKGRFSIIDLKNEEETNLTIKSQSQTDWITCYTFESNIRQRIKFNIIDTPGFADTRGIQRDKELVDQIRHFFTAPLPNGILCLDAVCLVVQAPMMRLTSQQKYVFNSVLSLFGNNMSNNIFVLVTFALDDEEPPVKSALETENIPVDKLFTFNNSALFGSTQNADKVNRKHFWDMGKRNFDKLYINLLSTDPVSLQLTNEVLQLRENLECTIQGLMPQINEGLHMINRMKKEKKIIDDHKDDIEANKDFVEDSEEDALRRVNLNVGEYVTNCLECNRTCHYPCYIKKTEHKSSCWAIDGTGNCRICPRKCIWSKHCNNEYRFEFYTKKVRITKQIVLERWLSACSQEKKHSNMLRHLNYKFRDICNKVFSLINEARNCINKLNQKALKHNPVSQVEYIEQLIQAEEAEQKHGWENRAKVLRTFKGKAKLMNTINDQEFQPWIDEEVSDLLQELQNS